MRRMSQTVNPLSHLDYWQSFRRTIQGMFSTLYAGYEAVVQAKIFNYYGSNSRADQKYLRADLHEL